MLRPTDRRTGQILGWIGRRAPLGYNPEAALSLPTLGGFGKDGSKTAERLVEFSYATFRGHVGDTSSLIGNRIECGAGVKESK